MSSSAAAWMSAAGTPSRTARSRSAVKGSWETKISDSMRFLRGLFMGTRPARILKEPDELLHLDFDRDVPAADRPGVVGRPALHHEEKGFGQVEEGEFHRLELVLAVGRGGEIPLPPDDPAVLPPPGD